VSRAHPNAKRRLAGPLIRVSLLVVLVGHVWDSMATPETPVGALSRMESHINDGPVPGRWKPVRVATRSLRDPDLAADLEALNQIGYAAGVGAPGGRRGVTTHDGERTDPGLNLWNSGHAEIAYLMDMEGRIVHQWSFDIDSQLTDEQSARFEPRRWRRVHLFPDGDLLAIYEGHFLIKLDRHSRLLWMYDGGAHHDVFVHSDGSIYVLTRKARVVPFVHPNRACLEDFVAVLDRDGRELTRVSILEAFRNSDFAPVLERMPEFGDVTHTNTIERLDGRQAAQLPAFRDGNVLVSLREVDTIAVLDMEARRIVWALNGLWSRQHQPTVLENGNLLVFDNKGAGGMSRVLEVNPRTQAVSWSYVGTPENAFYSAECGSAQRLPNGNTLISETDAGRAFEVTPSGEVVWEFHNPHTAGSNAEYVASLFEVIRLPADFGADWIGDEVGTSR
jgi:hypothetical protein